MPTTVLHRGSSLSSLVLPYLPPPPFFITMLQHGSACCVSGSRLLLISAYAWTLPPPPYNCRFTAPAPATLLSSMPAGFCWFACILPGSACGCVLSFTVHYHLLHFHHLPFLLVLCWLGFSRRLCGSCLYACTACWFHRDLVLSCVLTGLPFCRLPAQSTALYRGYRRRSPPAATGFLPHLHRFRLPVVLRRLDAFSPACLGLVLLLVLRSAFSGFLPRSAWILLRFSAVLLPACLVCLRHRLPHMIRTTSAACRLAFLVLPFVLPLPALPVPATCANRSRRRLPGLPSCRAPACVPAACAWFGFSLRAATACLRFALQVLLRITCGSATRYFLYWTSLLCTCSGSGCQTRLCCTCSATAACLHAPAAAPRFCAGFCRGSFSACLPAHRSAATCWVLRFSAACRLVHHCCLPAAYMVACVLDTCCHTSPAAVTTCRRLPFWVATTFCCLLRCDYRTGLPVLPFCILDSAYHHYSTVRSRTATFTVLLLLDSPGCHTGLPAYWFRSLTLTCHWFAWILLHRISAHRLRSLPHLVLLPPPACCVFYRSSAAFWTCLVLVCCFYAPPTTSFHRRSGFLPAACGFAIPAVTTYVRLYWFHHRSACFLPAVRFLCSTRFCVCTLRFGFYTYHLHAPAAFWFCLRTAWFTVSAAVLPACRFLPPGYCHFLVCRRSAAPPALRLPPAGLHSVPAVCCTCTLHWIYCLHRSATVTCHRSAAAAVTTCTACRLPHLPALLPPDSVLIRSRHRARALCTVLPPPAYCAAPHHATLPSAWMPAYTAAVLRTTVFCSCYGSFYVLLLPAVSFSFWFLHLPFFTAPACGSPPPARLRITTTAACMHTFCTTTVYCRLLPFYLGLRSCTCHLLCRSARLITGFHYACLRSTVHVHLPAPAHRRRSAFHRSGYLPPPFTPVYHTYRTVLFYCNCYHHLPPAGFYGLPPC